jgi:perosamine synthetase
MIPRFRPHFSLAEWFAALRFWQRGAVGEFEVQFARKFGQKFAVAFPHGRTGLLALLEALRVKGKFVVCPSYTCVVVAHAIKYSGNEPLFLDSDTSDFNMNFDQIPAAESEKIGAIVATSIFGHPVNLDKLDQVRKALPGIPVIQDCCHSYNCEWQGRSVQREGEASFFALNISKIINSVFGGMVLTDREDIYRDLLAFRERKLRSPSLGRSMYFLFYLIASSIAFIDTIYGITEWLSRKGLLAAYIKYYDESQIDMPKDYLTRMTPLQARVGLVQLRKFDEIIRVRRRCAELYHAELAHHRYLELPPARSGSTYSHYVVRTAEARPIKEFFLGEGVQLGEIIEYNVGDMTPYRSAPIGKYPVAGGFVGHTLNLPVCKFEDAKRVVRVFKKYQEEAKLS